MTTSINPQDKKWQASELFKPDKASLWKYPAEKDGWIHSHNAIRREVDKFISGLKSIYTKFPNSTPDWAVSSIQQFWMHHYEVIKDHHRNEDEIMTPFMKTRVVLPEKLEADHEVLITKMKEVQLFILQLRSGDSLDSIIDSMEAYKMIMFPHLQEEEQIALPLLRAYFRPQEVKVIVQKIGKSACAGELGSLIDIMGADYFRSTFMTQEGIPFFLWHLKFRRDYNHFVNNVKGHLEALEGGVPMSAPKKASILC